MTTDLHSIIRDLIEDQEEVQVSRCSRLARIIVDGLPPVYEAAPDLLAACEEAMHELRIRCGYKPGDHAYDTLVAAIAKTREATP